MPTEKMINNQYLIEETLHHDAFQKIHLASDQFTESKNPVYVTVFKDMDAGSPITNAFLEYENELKEIFIDIFMLDDVLYTVSRCCPGKPLTNFITNTYLNPYEKGMIVSSFLNHINAFEALPLMLKYVLCSFGNISIVDRKLVCFNHIPFFSPQDLIVTHKEYLQRIGDFILTVYGNSMTAELTPEIKEMEPAVDAIIRNCYNGSYDTVEDIQKDFNPVYFRSRMRQDEARPFVATTSSDSQTPLRMPDHPDAPRRSFLYTREKKEGRKSKKAKKVQRLAVSLALIIVVFFAGVFGISRLLTGGPADSDRIAENDIPYDENGEENNDLDDLEEGWTEDPEDESLDPDEMPAEFPEDPVAEMPGEEAPTTDDPPAQYTVQSGDTLYSISQEMYGDGNRYPEIMEANNITDPTALSVGQVLQIP